MEQFLKSVFSVLPSVASHPLAFLAYIFAIAVWLVIALKVARNKNLLKNLDKLPERDRLKALEREMGVIHIKEGLTPSQYLKSRIHLYYFLGFAIICSMGIVIFVISAVTGRHKEGTENVDLTPYLENQKRYRDRCLEDHLEPEKVEDEKTPELSIRNEFNQDECTFPYNVTLIYTYERVKDKIYIKPEMPYLTHLRNGLVDREVQRFNWQLPQLAIKVVNNTSRTLLITEAAISVESSNPNKEPVLLVNDTSRGSTISFQNEGWGDVVDPVINIGIEKISACYSAEPMATRFSIKLPTFSKEAGINLKKYISPNLSKDKLVCVFGVINYSTENREQHKLRFKTDMRVEIDEGGGGEYIPPSHTYDLFLEPNMQGHVQHLPVSQEIKAGEADVFLIRIATAKSTLFDLSFSFRTAEGEVLPGNRLFLSIFVPRSEAHLIGCKQQ